MAGRTKHNLAVLHPYAFLKLAWMLKPCKAVSRRLYWAFRMYYGALWFILWDTKHIVIQTIFTKLVLLLIGF